MSRLSSGHKNQFKTLMLFGGDVLSQSKLERPFSPEDGDLRLLNNPTLTSSFGTGIHTVSPAHEIESLRLAYMHKLSRSGCVDSTTGKLTYPPELQDVSIHDSSVTNEISSLLKRADQFFTSYKNHCTVYKTISNNGEDEPINLISVDAWFV